VIYSIKQFLENDLKEGLLKEVNEESHNYY